MMEQAQNGQLNVTEIHSDRGISKLSSKSSSGAVLTMIT